MLARGMRVLVIGALALAIVVGVLLAGTSLLPFTSLEYLTSRYAAADSRFVSIDGVRLHLRDEGARDAPPVILLHGSFGSLRMWEDWARTLRDRYRVLRIDIPPNGLSGPDPTGRYGYARAEELVIGLMDQLRLERAAFAGTSSGAVVAYRLAARRPERTSALIVSNFPVERVRDDPPLAFVLSAWVSDRLLSGFQSTFQMRQMLEYLVHDDALVTPQLVAEYRDMANRIGKREQVPRFVAGMTTEVRERPRDLIARIRAPTLVIWSDHDRVLPLAALDKVLAMFTATTPERFVVAGAGHLPTIERGADSAAAARRFLDAKLSLH